MEDRTERGRAYVLVTVVIANGQAQPAVGAGLHERLDVRSFAR
jgi:hypothetical protein